ncbi:MAG: MerR family transcriptional regulator [Acidobacteriaceae bacterium]
MAKQASERLAAVPVIPDKLYFRIGEAARLCGVEAYVLRFWEKEFPQLRPSKGGTGQRLYRRRDVELALRIKQLVHREGYTIAGARQQLAQEIKENRRKPQPELIPISSGKAIARPSQVEVRLQRLRMELRDIQKMLSTEPSPTEPRTTPARPRTTERNRPQEPLLFE